MAKKVVRRSPDLPDRRRRPWSVGLRRYVYSQIIQYLYYLLETYTFIANFWDEQDDNTSTKLRCQLSVAGASFSQNPEMILKCRELDSLKVKSNLHDHWIRQFQVKLVYC